MKIRWKFRNSIINSRVITCASTSSESHYTFFYTYVIRLLLLHRIDVNNSGTRKITFLNFLSFGVNPIFFTVCIEIFKFLEISRFFEQVDQLAIRKKKGKKMWSWKELRNHEQSPPIRSYSCYAAITLLGRWYHSPAIQRQFESIKA